MSLNTRSIVSATAFLTVKSINRPIYSTPQGVQQGLQPPRKYAKAPVVGFVFPLDQWLLNCGTRKLFQWYVKIVVAFLTLKSAFIRPCIYLCSGVCSFVGGATFPTCCIRVGWGHRSKVISHPYYGIIANKGRKNAAAMQACQPMKSSKKESLRTIESFDA